jgi:hypothetical protein
MVRGGTQRTPRDHRIPGPKVPVSGKRAFDQTQKGRIALASRCWCEATRVRIATPIHSTRSGLATAHQLPSVIDATPEWRLATEHSITFLITDA